MCSTMRGCMIRMVAFCSHPTRDNILLQPVFLVSCSLKLFRKHNNFLPHEQNMVFCNHAYAVLKEIALFRKTKLNYRVCPIKAKKKGFRHLTTCSIFYLLIKSFVNKKLKIVTKIPLQKSCKCGPQPLKFGSSVLYYHQQQKHYFYLWDIFRIFKHVKKRKKWNTILQPGYSTAIWNIA